MMAFAIPLKTDSITFKNWAQEGNGANLTSGICFPARNSGELISSTRATNLLEACHDAASHEKKMHV